jgi:hypothetical protein
LQRLGYKYKPIIPNNPILSTFSLFVVSESQTKHAFLHFNHHPSQQNLHFYKEISEEQIRKEWLAPT